MRASMAYFAGAGTVLAAIVGGVGGGLLIADMLSPKSPKQGTETTRLERNLAPAPIAAAATPSGPVPYIAVPQPSAPGTTVAVVPAQPPTQTETANASAPAQPAETSQARPAEAPARQAEAPAPQPAAPAAQPVMQTAPDDAQAKARGGEARRAEGNRKSERRQQWTERRRYKPRQQQELIAVEENVREETEPRRVFAAEPGRIEMPLIKLFGPE